jgi:transcriptional regulator with XRE-family HTH domain
MEIKAFWNRVKSLIKKRGETQEKTAKACQIPINTFRGWITKEIIPPLSDAYRISRFLETSLEYLITGEEASIAVQINEAIDSLSVTREMLIKIQRNNP